ncbi:MAG: ABC transporter permease [Treponema sp.]|jgi:putative ABC transport system permease protein|nr:ABC transporter permease [Treponema sp.]
MEQIFRLALRNLKEHKTKTIIISCFFIFGVAIVILGNSFLESINRGLEKDFRANYTGDIVIGTNPNKGEINDIFGVNTVNLAGGIPQLPAIAELEKVEEIIQSYDSFEKKTKLISSQIMLAKGGDEVDLSAWVEKDDIGFYDMPISQLMAGEDKTYWDTFSGINFVEGDFPAANSNEIMIDMRLKKAFESLYDTPLNVGDNILVLGANANGIIREAKVSGFFKPFNENSAMFQTVYCNPAFARTFAKLTYGSSFSQELPENVDLSLSKLSEDELFGFSDADLFDDIPDDDTFLAETELDFNSILGDTSLRDKLNKTDDGAWHFIIIKVKHAFQTEQIINSLNEKFEAEGLNVNAMNWKKAAYSYSQTVEGIGIIFNLLIIILAVVVFIIIMNTMTVSIIERTSEIGTMRAIGAKKSFVKLLFFTESCFLAVVSSVIGIILAFILMSIFNSLGITITNSIAKMILGGGLLHFSPTFKIIALTLAVALAGSILSNLYPVRSALRITPLKALSRE